MSTETLLTQLEEYKDLQYVSIDRERRNLVLQILKQQQQTIREQKELIESLWAWAEEKDEAIENESDLENNSELKNNSLTENEYDASVYTQIM